MPQKNSGVEDFLTGYTASVQTTALRARASLFKAIPGCTEILDAKARVIGYGYGAGYADTVCVLIMSKTGVKLGLPDGVNLPDPANLLRGAGRRHRHVQLTTPELIDSAAVKALIRNAYSAYKVRRKDNP